MPLTTMTSTLVAQKSEGAAVCSKQMRVRYYQHVDNNDDDDDKDDDDEGLLHSPIKYA